MLIWWSLLLSVLILYGAGNIRIKSRSLVLLNMLQIYNPHNILRVLVRILIEVEIKFT